MKISHSWNYYLKRKLSKGSTWLILFLQLAFWALSISTAQQLRNPHIIDNNNDFFGHFFWYLLVTPVVTWTFVITPLSWLFWGWIDNMGQETKKDGTDLFFLSTEIPTSRSQVFWGKIVFLTCSLFGLYLISCALPLSLLWWKIGFFGNFTGLQTFLFLTCNFLIAPLLFFVPLVIFLFSLASLNSIWYTILKWLFRLSLIIFFLLGYLVFQGLYQGEGIGKKVVEYGLDFWNWLKENYLLLTLTIIGVIIGLALLTFFLAYKKFREEDLS